MAYASTHTTPQPRSFGFARLFSAIGTALVALAEADSHVRRVQALNEKSDAELARMGLKREDIVRHVFGVHYL